MPVPDQRKKYQQADAARKQQQQNSAAQQQYSQQQRAYQQQTAANQNAMRQQSMQQSAAQRQNTANQNAMQQQSMQATKQAAQDRATRADVTAQNAALEAARNRLADRSNADGTPRLWGEVTQFDHHFNGPGGQDPDLYGDAAGIRYDRSYGDTAAAPGGPARKPGTDANARIREDRLAAQSDAALTGALNPAAYEDSADTADMRARQEARQAQLAEMEGQRPDAFSSRYDQQLNAQMDNILNRKNFSYDMNADPAYQAYAKAYQNAAQQSMLNSLQAATANNGGFGSSTAQMAAQSAYAQQMNNMTNMIPTLMNDAYNRYQDSLQNQRDDVGMLQDADQTDYNRYRDTYGDWQDERGYYADQERAAMGDLQNSKSFDYARYSGDKNYNLAAAQSANSAYSTAAQVAQGNRSLDQSQQRIDQEQARDARDYARRVYEDDRNYAEDTRRNNRDYARNVYEDERNYAEDTRRNNRNYDEDVRRYNQDYAEDVRRNNRNYDEDVRRYNQDYAEDVRRNNRDYDESVLRDRRDYAEDVRRNDRDFAENNRRWDAEYDYRTNRDYVEDEWRDKEWQHQIGREGIVDKRYDQEYADSRDDTMWSRGREEKWDPWTQQGLDQDLRYNAQNAVYKQIQMGMDPTDADLAAGGMTRAQANAMRAWLGMYGVSSGGSGGRGGSGGGGSNSGDTGGGGGDMTFEADQKLNEYAGALAAGTIAPLKDVFVPLSTVKQNAPSKSTGSSSTAKSTAKEAAKTAATNAKQSSPKPSSTKDDKKKNTGRYRGLS